MSKGKKITSYFHPKKKQSTCENETQPTPIVVSIEVTEDEDGVKQ